MEKKKTNGLYIDAKESRNIAKENRRAIKAITKQRAAYQPEDYITEIANGESADNVFAMWQADIGAV